MKQERLLQIILSPHVSEKATIIAEKYNQYVFKVIDSATKHEIKDAVEYLFSTKVKSIRMVNVRAKKKLFRNIDGIRKGWKKAYITLEEGQKLEILNAQ